MKKKTGRFFLIIIIGLLLTTLSCAPRVPEKHYAGETPEFNMLISYQPTPFKDHIVSQLVEKYQPIGNIDVVGISNLKNTECDAYDAIVIMDTCKAWSFFNFSMKSFIKKSNNCNNIVLYMTAGDPDWKYQYKGLDAVTSASIVGEEDRVVKELTNRIDQMISLRS